LHIGTMSRMHVESNYNQHHELDGFVHHGFDHDVFSESDQSDTSGYREDDEGDGYMFDAEEEDVAWSRRTGKMKNELKKENARSVELMSRNKRKGQGRKGKDEEMGTEVVQVEEEDIDLTTILPGVHHSFDAPLSPDLSKALEKERKNYVRFAEEVNKTEDNMEPGKKKEGGLKLSTSLTSIHNMLKQVTSPREQKKSRKSLHRSSSKNSLRDRPHRHRMSTEIGRVEFLDDYIFNNLTDSSEESDGTSGNEKEEEEEDVIQVTKKRSRTKLPFDQALMVGPPRDSPHPTYSDISELAVHRGSSMDEKNNQEQKAKEEGDYDEGLEHLSITSISSSPVRSHQL